MRESSSQKMRTPWPLVTEPSTGSVYEKSSALATRSVAPLPTSKLCPGKVASDARSCWISASAAAASMPSLSCRE